MKWQEVESILEKVIKEGYWLALQRSCFQLLSKANLIPPEMINQFSQLFFLILVFQVLPSFHTFALNNKVKRNMDPSIGLYFIKDKFKWRIINIKIQALFKKCQCCLPFQVYLANKNWGILVPTWFCRNDQLNCFCLIPVETRTYKSTYSLSPIKLFHLLAPTVNIFLLF